MVRIMIRDVLKYAIVCSECNHMCLDFKRVKKHGARRHVKCVKLLDTLFTVYL